MSRISILIPLLALFAAGCSRGSRKELVVMPAGEKATSGPLVYSVIDTRILPQIGEDPTSVRTPQNRFFLVQVAVSNSSSQDQPIPGLTLVDDAGQQYAELADGTGVPNWLGVVRKVGGAQTEQGTIVFDAPAQHYRLRLTEDTDASEIAIDVPLNYQSEQVLPPVPEGTQQLKIPQK
jgi:hypothetical protein